MLNHFECGDCEECGPLAHARHITQGRSCAITDAGGSMRIESAPGRGTTVRLSAPPTNGRVEKARVRA